MDIEIRELILNTKHPLVIKNFEIPWKCFETPLSVWCEDFDLNSCKTESNKLEFETASRTYMDVPQWEKNRSKISMTCKEFLASSQEEENGDISKRNWFALSYRNINEMPEICKLGISFSCFGFPLIEDDCTFWLSSKGAHTPCHYDTYGCNVVVQVYGRKMWLLFPPDAELTSVRVPYEESSVYCSETFYSPRNFAKFQNISKECYKCILEPNDVLIVPRKWWHYVENLETALSVNTWIPLEIDSESQLEECIVKYLIEKCIQTDDEKIEVLNPNQFSKISSENELLKILEFLAKEIEKDGGSSSSNKIASRKYPYQYMSEEQLKDLIDSMETPVESVRKLSEEEFYNLMKSHSNRYDSNLDENNTTDVNIIKTILLNSICHPSVVQNIKELFLKNYENTITTS